MAKDAFTICKMIARRPPGDGHLENMMRDTLRVQPDAPKWSSFTYLVECAWWSRVWVEQEFVLARVAVFL